MKSVLFQLKKSNKEFTQARAMHLGYSFLLSRSTTTLTTILRFLDGIEEKTISLQSKRLECFNFRP